MNLIRQNDVIKCIGFRMGSLSEKIKNVESFDVCYSIDENEWNGEKSFQLKMKDIKLQKESISRFV